MNIIGIIPARGGSKRIPKKNLKLLKGKPLIEYTILEAKKSKFLTSVYISTEDKKISQFANKLKIEVIPRPKKLAQDRSQSYLALQHAVKYLETKKGKNVDIIVTLQPTSPLRKSVDIDNSISHFLKNNCDSLVSITNACFPPEFMFRIKGKKLVPILNVKLKSKRTQDMPKTFQINGAVYVTRKQFLMKNNSSLSKNPCFYIMPFERSIDIDSLHDFEFCKLLM